MSCKVHLLAKCTLSMQWREYQDNDIAESTDHRVIPTNYQYGDVDHILSMN